MEYNLKHKCKESEGKIQFIKIVWDKDRFINFCEDCGKELNLEEIL